MLPQKLYGFVGVWVLVNYFELAKLPDEKGFIYSF